MYERLIPCLTLAILAQTAFACLWDYDTLLVERSRFPEIHELIVGKFPHHSEAFYQWRIKDRLRRLTSDPDNLRLLDDLSVAYDKIGDNELAIQTALRKESLAANTYETHANLGTFYIHSGRFEEGLQQLDQAIEINPEAHFGREVYQKKLVEYLISRQLDGKIHFPIDTTMRRTGKRCGFALFILGDQRLEPDKVQEEIQQAIKGVTGMMRFGNHASPILLEVLGDLLMADSETDAKRLAARAFLKASYETDGVESKAAYREIASGLLQFQTVRQGKNTELTLGQLEGLLRTELDAANTWHDELKADEDQWIKDGANVEEEYREKYLTSPPSLNPSNLNSLKLLNLRPVTIGIGIMTLGTATLLIAKRKSIKKAKVSSER